MIKKLINVKILLLFFLFFSNISAQWEHLNLNFGGNVNCFVAAGNNIFVGTGGNGVFLSTDYGNVWIPVNSGLSTISVNAFTVSGSIVFAGTTNGIFKSTNNGMNWVQTGLSGNMINTFTQLNNFIFAG
ncbi:MAG: hypothetical protein NTU73_04835, partial [Ignavibacteriae bacterium]|nr:hypothetical protein [Ignavibacteriota bacterium]